MSTINPSDIHADGPPHGEGGLRRCVLCDEVWPCSAILSELARIRGAVAQTTNFGATEDYDDWLNGLMENAPEEIDGDVAMEELVLQYIHWLEDQVPGVSTRIRNAKCMGCPDHGLLPQVYANEED